MGKSSIVPSGQAQTISLEQFRWSWPETIDQMQIKDLFRLQFIRQRENVIFLGGVGVGKTHLATALGYHACLNGCKVLFTNTIDVINALTLARKTGRLKQELNKYIKPVLVIFDEPGYLPIDKSGADLLFQVLSGRYETGSTIITSNRAFNDWPETFNNDSTLTSALLDRLLRHAQTVVIEGKSYRMKDKEKPRRFFMLSLSKACYNRGDTTTVSLGYPLKYLLDTRSNFTFLLIGLIVIMGFAFFGSSKDGACNGRA